jgi:2-polyprenyl-3-methyl-5-hydroxy-6-metoxy-1,4-benzoquinol methylase
MFAVLRRRIARAIIIDRASGKKNSVIDRIAKERSEENYRFAAQFVEGKAVLDIGGGTGIGHDHLLANNPCRVLSLDKAVCPQKTLRHLDSRLEYWKSDFLEQDFADTLFDVVLCLGTLFYIPDHDAALGKMERLLRPGGLLIINCINDDLVTRYFGMQLRDIDLKFSGAYGTSEFRALLEKHFGTEPVLYVQQPVSLSTSVFSRVRLWTAALLWPFARHPVLPRATGKTGMYNYAVVTTRSP